MAFWNWSRTAATNATADPTIVWSEGQAPSSVNDSARAMMARLAEWRDDITGANVAGAGPINYVLTSNQGFDSLAHMGNQTLAILIVTTCGDNPTLNVDGLGAKPIHSAGGVAISAGTLIANTPYRITYFPTTAEFVLNDFYGNPYSIPIGGLMPYLGATAPNSNFVLPFGQAISRTTYTTLFSLVSTTFGGGDGSTTFNVPDLRGKTIFAQDNMGGVARGFFGAVSTDNGTIVGTTIGSVGGSTSHVMNGSELPVHAHGITDVSHSHNFATGSHGNPTGSVAVVFNTGGTLIGVGGSAVADTLSIIGSGTGLSGTNNAGGSASMSIVPPAMILPYILRVI